MLRPRGTRLGPTLCYPDDAYALNLAPIRRLGDISNWDTAKVTSFKRVLMGATKFDGDLSKWDVSSYPAGLPLYTGSTTLNPPEPDFYG